MLTDIHCHIIPGVDDGARTIDEARGMLSAAKRAGIGRIVATPHAYHLYKQRTEVLNAYAGLRKFARELDIELTLGYEVNWRAIVSMDWASILKLSVEGTRKLLLELPSVAPFPNLELVITEMCKHMSVVIVHPERCVYFQRDVKLLDRLREAGCETQIDAHSLFASRLYGQTRFARRLVNTKRADYIASDAHSALEFSQYERALKLFPACFERDFFKAT